LYALAAGDTCSAHGLSPAAADVTASLDDLGYPSTQAICVLPQLPTSEWVNGSCTGSTEAGWCYLTGAAAESCPQTIVTSASGAPPAGAVGVFVCGQTPPSEALQGTRSDAVGASCTPSPELSPSFAGFNSREVTLDENNASCGGDVCLVNHFQGLTDCAYGQEQDGGPAPGAITGCTVPGTSTPVMPNAAKTGQQVLPQCVDRETGAAVYCTCRCANTAGQTNDGATYCTCPSGFSCTPLVPAGQSGDPRAGAYCIKEGTAYDANTSCNSWCDPTLNNCP
jgi:hypothetical protein